MLPDGEDNEMVERLHGQLEGEVDKGGVEDKCIEVVKTVAGMLVTVSGEGGEKQGCRGGEDSEA